jgi:2'-5' RNA ligase
MRLFVALELPESVRTMLSDLMAAWKPLVREGVRWVRPEGMHITLKFIGHVDTAKLPEIQSALAPIRSESRVEIDIRGAGFFPDSKGPRVLWCGVQASPNLAALAAEIDHALIRLEIPAEARAFKPHLTLARLSSPAAKLAPLIAAAEKLGDCEFGSVRETEFHLYESILQRGGAQYRKVQSYPFVKGAE